MLAAETSAAGADLTEISKTGSHLGAKKAAPNLKAWRRPRMWNLYQFTM
jgi:hypothetical protein